MQVPGIAGAYRSNSPSNCLRKDIPLADMAPEAQSEKRRNIFAKNIYKVGTRTIFGRLTRPRAPPLKRISKERFSSLDFPRSLALTAGATPGRCNNLFSIESPRGMKKMVHSSGRAHTKSEVRRKIDLPHRILCAKFLSFCQYVRPHTPQT